MVDPRLAKKPGEAPPLPPAPGGSHPVPSTPLKPVAGAPTPIRLAATPPPREPPKAAPEPAAPAHPTGSTPAATPAASTGAAPVPQFTRPPPATATPPTDAGVAPPPSDAPPPKLPPKANVPLQRLVEISTILVFLLVAIVPFESFISLGVERVNLILVAGSFILTGAVLLFGPANYQVKKRNFDEQLLRKYRRDMILTSLSVGATFVTAIMAFFEGAALLAFLDVISRQSEASVAANRYYPLFAAFTLIFLTMLLIVRTSFETRSAAKKWHAPVSYVLLALAGVISGLALLVNYGVLTKGAFSQIEPAQAIYIFTLAVLFQIIAFKLLLRYPSITQIIVKEMEAARKANQELRDQLQKRAYRAYFFGLAFVVLSMFLLGGVATRRLGTGGGQNVTFILILYLTLGIVVLGVMATRYVQHKYIASRAKRQASGEVIAKKRMSKAELNRFILFGASGMFAFLALVAGVLTFLGVLPIQGKYGTDFMILAFLVGFGPYGFYRGKQIKRIRSMDDKFPDFLRDLAESERAGMTLPRALQTAAKGLYGGLTGEVRHMSAQVSWGVSFTDAIQRFAKRVNTPLISRTVALIVEASRAGGNVIDILTAASDDAREIKQIVDERKRQMGIYGIIVYIAFFVFLVVIFVLSKQFLPAFSAAAKAGEGSELGGGGIKSFDVESFVTVFFHSALVQGIGGGLVSGVMQEGHPLGGLKHAVILTIVSWIVFRLFVDDLLSKLLGG